MRLDDAQTSPVAPSTTPPPGREPGRARSRRGRSRAGLASGVLLARLRLTRSRLPLLFAAGLGIVLAVTLVCVVPVLSPLISTIQIQSTVRSAPPLSRNVENYEVFITEQMATDLHRYIGDTLVLATLTVTVRYARRLGVGKALRLGED